MKTSAPVATVDPQHPWLGLVSFTEETRGYFHGREAEAAELSRRVQRKLLTVLFGQSGLGKTSILQAGLVPRLRPEGFCPVYVRLDYDPNSPPPAEQIKRAVLRATAAAGTWTQTGSAVEGETLWEFLHHRDDVLHDATGRVLTPILIFDQFEEIFTLAQSDETGRRRANEFLADLADLVENRPPAALEARIEREEADASRFDFARADYRILISLREDYLAHLEGLKGQMPSVTQNRMRLARMTGAQAVAAVRGPSQGLVSEAVAEAVVRFVAGSADLASAEVEPSLLSLICRELNDTRLAQGQSEISADLLAGSRDAILSEFYERVLADQPPGVRLFIEDEMLTDSGFRESVAEERVRKAFAAAGARPDALTVLVDRRLLRVEDRLDLRRVEITHDVLCKVIGASRNIRRERQALEESQRQLAAQKAAELATRRQLGRARRVAAIAVAIMLLAVGSAVFGWLNLRRARAAEAGAVASEDAAKHSRQLAEVARRQAEQLLSFLVGDFYRDLVANGQVELFRQLAERSVAYYRELPPELVTGETERNRALALAALGRALNEENRTDDALRPVTEAIDSLQRRVTAGDKSTETLVGLSLALRTRGDLYTNQALFDPSLTATEQAVAVLRPLVQSGNAPAAAQLEYAEALLNLGQNQYLTAHKGEEAFAEAQQHLAALGGGDSKNVQVASLYALALMRLGRSASARGDDKAAYPAATEGVAIAAKLFDAHPTRVELLNYRGIGNGYLYNIASHQGHTRQSLDYAMRSEEDYKQYIHLSPDSSRIITNLTAARTRVGMALVHLGRASDGSAKLREALDGAKDQVMSSGLADTLTDAATTLSYFDAEMLNEADAMRTKELVRHYTELSVRDTPAEGFASLIAKDSEIMSNQGIDLLLGKSPTGVHAALQPSVARVEEVDAKDPASRRLKDILLWNGYSTLAQASVLRGQFAEAETESRHWADAQKDMGISNDVDRINYAFSQDMLAQALAGLGRLAEARAVVEPQVALMRRMTAASPDDQLRRLDLGGFLLTHAAALEPSDRAERQSELDECEKLFAALSPELAACSDPRDMMRRLKLEQAKLAAGH